MNEYQFIASTVEAEKKISFIGTAALLVPAGLLVILLKGFMADIITNQALVWLLVVVPSLVSFSMVMQFFQRHYVGVFAIRMEGKHVTLVHPDCSVRDLGKIEKASLQYSGDGKRADLLLVGSKDEALLRLRSAAAWNGRSKAKDFATVDKAVADINAALA